MKQKLLSFIIILFIATSCQDAKEPNTVNSELTDFADSLFQTSIDSTEIAGGAILVYQKGDTLLKKSYGYGSLELGTPMPPDGIFDIGSVTKQFTAAAILKLVEEGKLSLEDDFTKYMDFDTKGRKVTINNLLNHTSGIPSYTEIPEFWKMSNLDYPKDSLVRLVERHDFRFEPNEALIYNNSAYFFLGLIIEKVSGQSYSEFLKEEIFEPLGLHYTSYSSITEIVKNKVNGYGYSPNGLKQKGYQKHIWPYSAGSLSSSTEDLLIWMTALHDGKALTPSMYQVMISPDKLRDGSSVNYAKALVNYTNNGHQDISHGGAINGFSSYLQYFPQEDLYIICLVNTMGSKKTGQFFTNEITWKILDKKNPENVDLDIDPKLLEGSYIGPTRGNKFDTVKVNAIEEGIIIHQSSKDDKVDTLSSYIGNHTWAKGNNRIIIKNNEYREIQPYNYYILKKELK